MVSDRYIDTFTDFVKLNFVLWVHKFIADCSERFTGNTNPEFTRQSKKLAEEQPNKSAITDHVTRENHVIDWDQVKVIGHESDRKTRWIKEAIAIRKCKDTCMNRDSGSYLLPSSYDKLLRDPTHFHRNDTTRRRVDSHF